MRVPNSDESTVWDGPLKPGRSAIVGAPVGGSKCLNGVPPGTGKESMSGTSEKMLECRSSKFTDGRKSKEPEE